MKKIIIFTVLALFAISNVSAQKKVANDPNAKTFPPSEKVTTEKVSYYNRLGILIVADLYFPKGLDKNQKHAAIIVGHPFGGVKEQTAGLYAQAMAERGFVTIAFDASYGGESGGEPRNMISPEAFVEDFSAAVDYMGTRPYIDRDRIGVIGICGSGGFSISAAAIDPRIKAVSTVSMYDMGRDARQSINDTRNEAELRQEMANIVNRRYEEFEGSSTQYWYGSPWEIDENDPQLAKDFFDYYRGRGQHARSTTGMAYIGNSALINFYPFQHIQWISPRPVLFIAGENAHSRYFSEDAYKLAGEPKELLIVPGAVHVDLYDQMQYIPFDKLEAFYKEYLK